MNNFSSIVLPEDVKSSIKDKTLIVQKWNWDYAAALAFQKEAQRFVQENRDHKIYIFCNHPHCFTLGRGNERGNENLISFDDSLMSILKYETFKIHRGGGITFHYPGQWIFYPIVAVTEKNSLDDLMCWMLKSVKTVLEEDFNIDGILTAKKLMGVWKDKKKMASIGMGMNRFVTEHGLALNLIYDPDMFSEVKKINPCGMNSETYICVDEFISSQDLLNNFHSKFIKKFLFE